MLAIFLGVFFVKLCVPCGNLAFNGSITYTFTLFN